MGDSSHSSDKEFSCSEHSILAQIERERELYACIGAPTRTSGSVNSQYLKKHYRVLFPLFTLDIYIYIISFDVLRLLEWHARVGLEHRVHNFMRKLDNTIKHNN